MADNIVQGLFGLSPSQVAQNYQQQQQQSAVNAASPYSNEVSKVIAQNAYGMGSSLGNMGGMMLGRENPDVTLARNQEAIVSNADTTSPQGLMDLAQKFHAANMPQQAAIAVSKANELALNASTIAKNEATAYKDTNVGDAALIGKKERSQYAQQLVDAGLVEGSPDFNQEMAKYNQASLAKQNAPALKIQMGGSSSTPPKNLTREARLKWELDHEYIDQQTFDSAMSATGGNKLQTEKISSYNSAKQGFDAVERNLKSLYDKNTGKLTPSASPLFGKLSQYRPDLLQGQATIDAKTALDSITDQVMMANLADAKERVGQSFGSMQVQEWDKFTNQLASLKRAQSPESAATAMSDVLKFIQTKRKVLDAAMNSNNKTNVNTPDDSAKTTPSSSTAISLDAYLKSKGH